MKRMTWHVSILLVTGVAVEARSPQTQRRTAPQTQLEEIYAVRSVPESQTVPPESCAPTKTGIADAIGEVRYSLRSISTNTSDGRVLNANTIGTKHFCVGRTESPTILKAYAELRIAGKREDRLYDSSTGSSHLLRTRFQIVAVKYRKRSRSMLRIAGNDSGFALGSRVHKSRVAGSIITEVPTNQRLRNKSVSQLRDRLLAAQSNRCGGEYS